MAKSIAYLVSFCPAKREVGAHFISLQMNLSDLMNAPKHTIEAAGFADLERQIRSLAADFGQNCHASIQMADRRARKPSGFDAWRESMDFIDYVAPADAIAA
jgi:hypothetical protein